MNGIRIKVYKKLLKEIWDNYDGVEHFINDRIVQICCHEKLSVEEVIYFLHLCFLVGFC